jgi:predicted metalloprotease with PDZ domain
MKLQSHGSGWARRCWLVAVVALFLGGVVTTAHAQDAAAPMEQSKKMIIHKEMGPGKAFLGVVPRPLDHVLRAALDFEEPGILLAEVVPEGPAGQAGVKVGEILTKMNGKPIHDVDRLFALMKELKPGDTAELLLVHKGKSRTVKVTVAERPAPDFSWMGEHGELDSLLPGGMFFQGEDGKDVDIQVEDLGGMGSRKVKVITIDESGDRK